MMVVFGYLFGNYLAAGIYTVSFIAVIGAAIAIFAVKRFRFLVKMHFSQRPEQTK